MTRFALAACLALPLALPAAAQDGPAAARATLTDTDGAEIGTVYVRPNPSGIATISIALTDVPEGSHGVHVHETGDCSAADFTSAGGHLAGDAQHGVGVEGGPHPGDLPNVIATADGVVNVEAFNALLTMDMLFDDDGSAFIVHSGPDDYESQPSGESGDRIACGVFEEADDAPAN